MGSSLSRAILAHLQRVRLTILGLSGGAGGTPGRAPRSNPSYSRPGLHASGHVRSNPGLASTLEQHLDTRVEPPCECLGDG